MSKRASVDVGAVNVPPPVNGATRTSDSNPRASGGGKSKFLKRLSSASTDTVTTRDGVQNSRHLASNHLAERSYSVDERRSNAPATPSGAEPTDDRPRDHGTLKGMWKRAVQSLRRKNGKHVEKEDSLSKEVNTSNDVDPVYSILKVSAVLPKQPNTEGHGCCTVGPDGTIISITPANIRRGQGGDTCACPCHMPELLEGYHSEWIKTFVIKK